MRKRHCIWINYTLMYYLITPAYAHEGCATAALNLYCSGAFQAASQLISSQIDKPSKYSKEQQSGVIASYNRYKNELDGAISKVPLQAQHKFIFEKYMSRGAKENIIYLNKADARAYEMCHDRKIAALFKELSKEIKRDCGSEPDIYKLALFEECDEAGCDPY
jgi:hypothetical protein